MYIVLVVYYILIISGEGVPYNVSIVAVNAAGVSAEECVLTDFARQSSESKAVVVCINDLMLLTLPPLSQPLPLCSGLE